VGAVVASWAALATLSALSQGPGRAQKLPVDVAERLVSTTIEGGWTLRVEAGDPALDVSIDDLRAELRRARERVESFFGAPFPDPLTVTVAPDRATFSAVLRAEWGVPETECWMVATGVADFVVLLAPDRWRKEACEHDPTDEQHRFDLLVHELTHSYHGQRNPTRDFTGAEEVGWFAEGLAVLVAGQLDRNRLADPSEAIAQGAAPEHLSEAWSGKYRYGISGSIVELIDHDWGRATLVDLLALTREEELLRRLAIDEPGLLARWRAWVQARRGDAAPAPRG
jgi:hypothetical protein